MAHSQATLCYIVKDGRVLLIHKKRGVGAGKINAPGGKVEPGETPLEAAIRETQEEIGVTPLDPQARGELWFSFSDGKVVQCFIYLATAYAGVPTESEEARPEWFEEDRLPFERMWKDDQDWLPVLLGGKSFRGTVRIDGDDASRAELVIINNAHGIS